MISNNMINNRTLLSLWMFLWIAPGTSSLQSTTVPSTTRQRIPLGSSSHPFLSSSTSQHPQHEQQRFRRGQPHFLIPRGGSAEVPRTRISRTKLTSVLVPESVKREQPELIETIPADTSITNNDNIETIPSPETISSQLELPNRTRGGAVNIPARRPSLWKQYLFPTRALLPELFAEAFGTFVLLQMALGIVLTSAFTPAMPGVFPIAVLTGCAITAASAAVSSKCAAHFNPAITLAMCAHRNFGWNKLVPYSVAQLVGATGASLVNYGLFAGHIAQFEAKHGIVRNSVAGLQTAKSFACFFSSPMTPMAAFLAETFGTFMLSAVVFALTSNRNTQSKGLFIPPIVGATVALIISIIGPLSGASLNPVRELGPRLVLSLFGWSPQVAFAQVGTYVAAALTGATLGGWVVDKVVYAEPKMEPAWS